MPTTETTRRLSPLMMWVIVFAAVALAFAVFRSSTRDVLEVRAAAVNHQNLISSVSTNGKVEPIGEFQAYAPAAGVVGKVYVQVLREGSGRRSPPQNGRLRRGSQARLGKRHPPHCRSYAPRCGAGRLSGRTHLSQRRSQPSSTPAAERNQKISPR